MKHVLLGKQDCNSEGLVVSLSRVGRCSHVLCVEYNVTVPPLNAADDGRQNSPTAETTDSNEGSVLPKVVEQTPGVGEGGGGKGWWGGERGSRGGDEEGD